MPSLQHTLRVADVGINSLQTDRELFALKKTNDLVTLQNVMTVRDSASEKHQELHRVAPKGDTSAWCARTFIVDNFV